MGRIEVSGAKLAEPYAKHIGKVKFQVTSFGNPRSKDSPQKLVLQMLETKVMEERMTNRP